MKKGAAASTGEGGGDLSHTDEVEMIQNCR